MTTNPERLWAFAKTYGGEDYVGIFAETEESVAEGERAGHEDDEHCAPVTAYVREDVAEAEAEAAALRRERDALAAEVAKLRHGIIIAREDTTDAVTRGTLNMTLQAAALDKEAVLAAKRAG